MDWIVSLTTLASMGLLAKKMWQGWAVGLANQALWLGLIFTRQDMYGLLPLAAALTCLYSWALWNWRKPTPIPRTVVRHDDPVAHVVRVPTEDGPDRMFREVPAAVIKHDPKTGEPAMIQVIDQHASPFGDRVELINVLVPEECFSTF